MKPLIAFILTASFIMLVYWLGGGNFERGPQLAQCTFFAVAAGIFARWFNKINGGTQ